MTFYDCKKRLSYTFFSGGPGKLRVKIHSFIQTKKLTVSDKNSVNEKAFNTIYNELVSDMNAS